MIEISFEFIFFTLQLENKDVLVAVENQLGFWGGWGGGGGSNKVYKKGLAAKFQDLPFTHTTNIPMI